MSCALSRKTKWIGLCLAALFSTSCNCGSTLQPNSSHIQVQPSALDFGAVTVGISVSKPIIIENVGDLPLDLEAPQIEGAGFSGPTSRVSIEAGAKLTLDITFTPQREGAVNGVGHFTDATHDADVELPIAGIGIASDAGAYEVLAGVLGGEGYLNGTAVNARFSTPKGVAVDAAGNVYVSEWDTSTIRKITPTGVVTTFAGKAGARGSTDGMGANARFSYPNGIAADGAGNVYVIDALSYAIRKISPEGVVTTWAGDAKSPGYANGSGVNARFGRLSSIAADAVGNVYVTGYSSIRKITPNGDVSTLAGSPGFSGSTDGTGEEARFNYLSGISTDATGNVYVTDTVNRTIRKISSAGVVTTLAGKPGAIGSADGTGVDATFTDPRGMATDAEGNIYVIDKTTIRKVTQSGVVTTIAGKSDEVGSTDETGINARFNAPQSLATDAAGNVYVADSENHTIRKVTPAGRVTTFAGKAATEGTTDGVGTNARFRQPDGIAFDAAGNVYVADAYNYSLRKVTPAGAVTTLAKGIEYFIHPSAVTLDAAGNVYVADMEKQVILRVTPNGMVSTFAGKPDGFGEPDGTGADARFSRPREITSDAAGNLYVGDDYGIRKVTPERVVTTLLPKGTALGEPRGLATDAAGNVYVADTGNSILKVSPQGVLTTLPGNFTSPHSIAIDSASVVYVASFDFDSTGEHSLVSQINSDGTVASLPLSIPTPRGMAMQGNTLVLSLNNALVRLRL